MDEIHWNKTLESYMHFLSHPDEYSEGETKPSMNFILSLQYCYAIAFKQAKIRDELFYKYIIFPDYSLRLVIASKRFLQDFELGIYLNDIFFKFPLVHANRLRFMPNKFWGSIIALEEYGDLSFHSMNNPKLLSENENIKKLFNNNPCTVFEMCRNYTLLMKQDHEELYKHGYGDINVSWMYDISLPKLLLNITAAIKTAYEVNQLLYRSFYQGYQQGMKHQFLSLSTEQRAFYGDLKGYINYFHESRWQSLTKY